MLAPHHMRAAAHIQLRMACQIERVRSVTQKACAFLGAKGLSKEELMACELALVEACNNAVLYAKPSRQFDPIELELHCDDSAVEMRVRDHTDGFFLPPKIELAGMESESGRGLFIMQSLMDTVEYEMGIGENVLTLRKQRVVPPTTQTILPNELNELKNKLAENEQIISEMAEELSSCYESLSAIFRSGLELGKSDNLPKFSRSLCEDLLSISEADWFLLRVVPKGESTLNIFSASIAVAPTSLSTMDSEAHSSAELKAAASRKDVWFNAKTPLDENDPLRSLPITASGLVHPFYFSEMLVGTLTIGKFSGQNSFTAAHVNVVHTFADFLAIQIVNARLRDEQINHRLVTHELEIAQGIQRALLPKHLPRLRGFGLAGFCESARHVGGDFYDAVQIDENCALLIIADVMGKGVPAAMFAAILRSVLRGSPELAAQPAALMSRVNQTLFDELSEVEMFITVQLAFVNVQARELILANAGHCPALLFSPEIAQPKLLSPDGMPLGILRDALYAELKIKIPEQSRIFIYTDGLTEARDPMGKMFGRERLENWITQSANIATADELKDSLASSLAEFQERTAPQDDQTFLILAEEIF